MGMSLREFLQERKLVGRWMILVAALVGAFAGAILMFLVAMLGLVS